VTAIDILLQPDGTMLEQCKVENARLLEAYPKGFALDDSPARPVRHRGE